MKSTRVLLVVCGATGLMHCGGELLVSEPGEAGATASGGTGGSTALTGGSAGRTQGGGAPANGSGGTGNSGSGHAGHGARTGTGGDGSPTSPAAGAGDEGGNAGQIGSAGQSGSGGNAGQIGSGGNAGEIGSACGCGSTSVLTAVACDGDSYDATLSDNGSTVLYLSMVANSSSRHSGLWTAANGTLYEVHGVMAGLSADGQTALFNADSGLGIMRRTSGGQTSLPLSLSDYLSRDGVTVVGRVETSSAEEVVTWTAAGGVVTPDFGVPAEGVYARVNALNADASVLGGQVTDGDKVLPFVWSGAGMHEIDDAPPLDPGASAGFVRALSDDGSVAAGIIATGETQNSPDPLLYALFRWTATDGVTKLGPCRIYDQHGGCDSSLFVGGDGAVLAGSVGVTTGSMLGKAFRWTVAGLVDIDPTGYGVVRGMSGDGDVIVGNDQDAETAQTTTPFVWERSIGKRSLTDRLTRAGAVLTGWTFDDVITVSRDGVVVVGRGTCNGVPALYRANLAPTAE